MSAEDRQSLRVGLDWGKKKKLFLDNLDNVIQIHQVR